MDLRLGATRFFCACCWVVSWGQIACAELAGVPALPTTPLDYVGYAVDNLPTHFTVGDLADANNTPADNAISNAGATLGRALFYDQRLSHNNSISCSSCHTQESGFTDTEQFSVGFEGGLTGRHSMGLANAAYYANGKFFWDERADTLEDQVLGPIQDSVEMGTDLDQLRGELAATEFYPVLFQEAFGSTEITNDRISKSLAQFVRSMVSYQSKFDEAIEAGSPESPNVDTFTALEQEGNTLFHARGSCSGCHETDAQIADRTHNIGLDVDNTADEGAGDGEFKVPSLRNVAVRGGFMHDGRFTTLEEVIDFYSTDIQDNPNLSIALKVGGPNGTPKQFNFSDQQKAALIAFLETLTDQEFLSSELFSDPFVELPGDFDDNGIVDAEDLAVWQDSLDTSDYGGGAGFLDWQRNLGNSWLDFATSSSGLAANAVPEPGTLLLLLLASPFVAMRRSRL